jgi:hypothetical protein
MATALPEATERPLQSRGQGLPLGPEGVRRFRDVIADPSATLTVTLAQKPGERLTGAH